MLLFNGKIDAYRICNYGCKSFWICDDTDENRLVLNSHGIQFMAHSFTAVDGTKVYRLEWD